MRLLNATTLQLECFFDDVPKYAILSHRWQDGEVSLQDMQNDTASKKPGFWKIKTCCKQALKDGLTHTWVDTCCIDKTSSAELSEAINSMYRWYARASICYAFLFDVGDLETTRNSHFGESMWWSRGWTLQELLAPPNVTFYNASWAYLGTKAQLRGVIHAITGIDMKMLDLGIPSTFSVAKRMSWASKRTTTRIEDVAYSLLGLFDVNMPMLYGEGEKAFIRLQEEIMKHSDDHSILAWRKTISSRSGLLATSPAAFASCHDIVVSATRLNRFPYFTTNMGLSIQLPMIPWAMNTYLAALDCEREGEWNSRVGIFLMLRSEFEQCSRVSIEGIDSIVFHYELIPKSEYKKLYVRQRQAHVPSSAELSLYGFHIDQFPLQSVPRNTPGVEKRGVISWANMWDDRTCMLEIPPGKQGIAGILWWKIGRRAYIVRFGFDASFNPICSGADCVFDLNVHTLLNENLEVSSFDERIEAAGLKLENKWVMTGDRIDGLQQREKDIAVSIKQKRLVRTLTWVVYLEFLGQEEPHYVMCNGCMKGIPGVRYRCFSCSNFDFCSACHVNAAATHPSHHIFRRYRKTSQDVAAKVP